MIKNKRSLFPRSKRKQIQALKDEKTILNERITLLMEIIILNRNTLTKESKFKLLTIPEIRESIKSLKTTEPFGELQGKTRKKRLTFIERINQLSPEIISNYQILREKLIADGYKPRISKNKESFYTHSDIVCSLVAFKSHIRVFLALDPRRYIDSGIPFGNASTIEKYAKTPLVIKITKSKLSLKRALTLVSNLGESINQ